LKGVTSNETKILLEIKLKWAKTTKESMKSFNSQKNKKLKVSDINMITHYRDGYDQRILEIYRQINSNKKL
jgi:hypothetical protein